MKSIWSLLKEYWKNPCIFRSIKKTDAWENIKDSQLEQPSRDKKFSINTLMG